MANPATPGPERDRPQQLNIPPTHLQELKKEPPTKTTTTASPGPPALPKIAPVRNVMLSEIAGVLMLTRNLSFLFLPRRRLSLGSGVCGLGGGYLRGLGSVGVAGQRRVGAHEGCNDGPVDPVLSSLVYVRRRVRSTTTKLQSDVSAG